MSVAAPPRRRRLATPSRRRSRRTALDAACPLCGAPLDPEQEWCLRCGAAARTRLAAPTQLEGADRDDRGADRALALGVLAAALVKLTGGSSTTRPCAPITTTITVATTPTVAGAIPTTTAGAVTPGTPTTITPGAEPAPESTGRGDTGNADDAAALHDDEGRREIDDDGRPATSTPATTTSTGAQSTASEEALRKAGFAPRSGQ